MRGPLKANLHRRSHLLAWIPILVMILVLVVSADYRSPAHGQSDLPSGGESVLPADALLTTPVGGLERTGATAEIVSITGQPFSKALHVTIRKSSAETNATQLTMLNTLPVEKGDTLLASFFLRGAATEGKGPAQIAFLFERTVNPWTKSVNQGVIAPKRADAWKRVLIPFAASESYKPGEVMASLRFAFGPQTVEIGGLSVVNLGKRITAAELITRVAEANLLGTQHVRVNLTDTRQTLMGFGGNFCQPRYESSQPMDAVGRYNLQHLHVVHARIGIPLNDWTPEKNVYRDYGPAHAALLQMQMFAKRKVPIVGTVWEGPTWLLGGAREQQGRRLAPEKYADCAEAIARFLVTARDTYGVTVDYFSFNEPDYGVNFLFTPAEMANFIRQAGPRFRALGLKTRFLIGDTTGGTPFVAYARPLLEDKEIVAYLGPLAFHCWDVVDAVDARYADIAALGIKYHKPVWCTEAGHDAQLWQTPDPWASWENALRTALAYEKTLRLAGASLMDYWTYQDNYPLVSADGLHPYPVFNVLQQLENVFAPGSRVALTTSDNGDLRALASVGPQPGNFAVLLINPIGPGRVILSGLPPTVPVTVVRSGATKQGIADSKPLRVDRNGQLTVAVPARSIVTLQHP